MHKVKLIKRITWYYPTEKFNAIFVFPMIIILSILSNSLKDVVSLVFGLLICIYILYQGQRYWKIKLYSLKGQPYDGAKNLAFFKKSNNINLLLIIFIPFVLFLQCYIFNIGARHQWLALNHGARSI